MERCDVIWDDDIDSRNVKLICISVSIKYKRSWNGKYIFLLAYSPNRNRIIRSNDAIAAEVGRWVLNLVEMLHNSTTSFIFLFIYQNDGTKYYFLEFQQNRVEINKQILTIL